MRASLEHRVARRSILSFAACPVLAVALLLLLPNGPVVPAAARRSKAAAKKAATSVRRTPAMRAAGEAGQRLIDTMTGRGSKGGSAEQLLDAAVAAYTDAAEDPANNQTEAWYQIGYLQKGFYQEEQKRLGEGAPALRRHRTGAFAAYADFDADGQGEPSIDGRGKKNGTPGRGLHRRAIERIASHEGATPPRSLDGWCKSSMTHAAKSSASSVVTRAAPDAGSH